MNFAHYWQYTDAVSKTLFFILFALSVLSWVVGILRILKSRKLANDIASDLQSTITSKQNDLSKLEFSQRKMVAEQTLLQKIAQYRFESEKGLPVLGTTAAIAPFIGLFGTVWGIFHALHSIAESGQAGLAQVAGPVGEALIMTALGLAVAIPAVVFFNIATRLNKRAMHVATDTAHLILAKTAS
ncbi:MotA/TolQ/ExbB proton channel family protein [Moraxella nasovis]|uniref:MotA/TolQ/ExbB proton channel family protein n=1 Tax=Moraxella nasovis TaxID=2904121 RepID=UPI001F61103E|nr:MotA/TolQ/ExbB proton channel family protein [Moraxella nasovis]UNU73321.1 MotA/TolQ/ExbB proton channel family protein [Moraxella nasovis]